MWLIRNVIRNLRRKVIKKTDLLCIGGRVTSTSYEQSSVSTASPFTSFDPSHVPLDDPHTLSQRTLCSACKAKTLSFVRPFFLKKKSQKKVFHRRMISVLEVKTTDGPFNVWKKRSCECEKPTDSIVIITVFFWAVSVIQAYSNNITAVFFSTGGLTLIPLIPRDPPACPDEDRARRRHCCR